MAKRVNPWDQRRWRGGECRPGLGGKVVGFWVVATGLCGAFATIALVNPRQLYFANVRWAVLFPYGLAAVGLIVGVAALVATARWLRFGGCRIRMRSLPGVIGGHFRGDVLLPEQFPADVDVRMELACDRTTAVSGSGDDDHGSRSVRREWSHTLRVTANAAYCCDGKCVLPFDFAVPYGLPDETDSKSSGDTSVEVRWHLRVFARLKGPDLDVKVRVPVFRTEASDPAVKGDSLAGKSLDAYLRDTGKPRRVRVENEMGANVYVCDAQGFQTGLCVVPGIIGLVFLAVAILVPVNALPGMLNEIMRHAEGWQNLLRLFPLAMSLGICLMMLVFGLLGLLFLLIAVRGLVFRKTWFESGMIRQRAQLFGIPWMRSCPCAEATGVNLGDKTTSGSQTWYDVVIERKMAARDKKGELRGLFRRITVASNVPTQKEADDLAVRLRRELHLPEGAEGIDVAGR